MHINADFSKRAIVAGGDAEWVASPMAGVERIMLDRVGDEVARATSIVRYAPGSYFPRHMHPLGEEFLVLEGVFSDEHHDYQPGAYVRNPPGTGHSPHSENGCRILVKLRQFDASDLLPVHIDTKDVTGWHEDEVVGGSIRDLHEYATERVVMRRFDRGIESSIEPPTGGLEWFVVDGELYVDDFEFRAESWLRIPAGDRFCFKTIAASVVLEKTGHLGGDLLARG